MSPTLVPFPAKPFDAAVRALLSPLDHPDADLWRRAVNDTCRHLLAADKATFVLPESRGAVLFSDEIPPSTLEQFEPRFAPLDARWHLWARASELGVWNRDVAIYPHQREFYRSEYHNEFIVPNRLFDTLACTMRCESSTAAGARASLVFHHDHPRRPRFGQRGATLLRLLFPIFEVATDTFRRYARHREDLVSTLDTLEEAVVVMDLDGSVLHVSRAVDPLLENEPERFRIMGEAQQLAHSLGEWLAQPGTQAVPPITSRQIRGHAGIYRLRGTCALTLFGPRPTPLVTIDRLPPAAPSEESLRSDFGLSRQEARVALLIAAGKSNEDIARTLSISSHTARHHTERLMLRLGIHSRSAIAALLSGYNLQMTS